MFCVILDDLQAINLNKVLQVLIKILLVSMK